MMKESISKFVIARLEMFCEDNAIEYNSLDNNTRLMGSGGLFDSLDLVNFIVEIEEGLEEDFDLSITLTDERAMSKRTSPFLNTETLTNFILEQANEE